MQTSKYEIKSPIRKDTKMSFLKDEKELFGKSEEDVFVLTFSETSGTRIMLGFEKSTLEKFKEFLNTVET